MKDIVISLDNQNKFVPERDPRAASQVHIPIRQDIYDKYMGDAQAGKITPDQAYNSILNELKTNAQNGDQNNINSYNQFASLAGNIGSQNVISALYGTPQGATPTPGPQNFQGAPQPGQGSSSTYTGSSGGTTGTTSGQPDLSGLPPQFQQLYTDLSDYLAKLNAKGQVLNPNIQITPEQVANFTHQAESEINPYYAGQLKLAREALLSSVGYSKDQIASQELQAQQTYGKNLRLLGETAADQGFAQSGVRNRAESELARDTNQALADNRRTLNFNIGNDARRFAQTYGSSELPQLGTQNAPQVGAGENKFTPGSNSNLYQLDPSIYQGLIGSEEFNRRGAVDSRASQLESAYRTQQGIDQARALTL